MEISEQSALDELRHWIGHRELRQEVLSDAAVARLSGALAGVQCPGRGDPLPPLWHWIYFNAAPQLSCLQPDGRSPNSDFLPVIALPSRMWASGRIRFLRDLRIGDDAQRETVVQEIKLKSGRNGPLLLVTLQHRLSGSQGLAIEEEQTILFHGPSAPDSSPSSSPPPSSLPLAMDWCEEVMPDSILLFSYSALTANAHRVHYDLLYTREVEGLPSLIVHGPLIVTLLIDRATRWADRSPDAVSFRRGRPAFMNQPLRLYGKREGDRIRLWAEDADGHVTMTAEAQFSAPEIR